jgi:hypothetical protein
MQQCCNTRGSPAWYAATSRTHSSPTCPHVLPLPLPHRVSVPRQPCPPPETHHPCIPQRHAHARGCGCGNVRGCAHVGAHVGARARAHARMYLECSRRGAASFPSRPMPATSHAYHPCDSNFLLQALASACRVENAGRVRGAGCGRWCVWRVVWGPIGLSQHRALGSDG